MVLTSETSTHLNYIFDTSSDYRLCDSCGLTLSIVAIPLLCEVGFVYGWVGGWGMALQSTQYCWWMDKLLGA